MLREISDAVATVDQEVVDETSDRHQRLSPTVVGVTSPKLDRNCPVAGDL
jgi:hypothetical protein